MSMVAFASRFPEIASIETRSMILRGQEKIPDGEYGLLEFYCDQADCDCRRVLLMVVSRDPSQGVLATINYGWESRDYYAKWIGDSKLADHASGASLEPSGKQSPSAPALLRLLVDSVMDSTYVERLKRHYALFRSDTRNSPTRKTWKPTPRTTKWRKR